MNFIKEPEDKTLMEREFLDPNTLQENYNPQGVLGNNTQLNPNTGLVQKAITGVVDGTVWTNPYPFDVMLLINGYMKIQWTTNRTSYIDGEMIREYVGPGYGITYRSIVVKKGHSVKFVNVGGTFTLISLSVIY